jgi:GxxExxY protein
MEKRMSEFPADINSLTEKIIGCAYKIGNTLGCGFLESVYQRAMAIELARAGLQVIQQHPIKVRYEGEVVGDFFADFVVDNTVLIELKAVKTFEEIQFAQCINYLKATGLKICLLINFGATRIQLKRIVL